jgi:hypothetical protein
MNREEVKMTDKRLTDAIKYLKQAEDKLAGAAQKLKDALVDLRARNPEAAKKIEDLTGSLEREQEEIGKVVQRLNKP